ncbi:uncharacterized protein LOC123273337 [Cotesia glomerata]|uniref:uncharacterized protein LOC123273337 n=1 Tax=Cotesia glomerata TaxID=32391 RepID=UPI001D00A196|nr:uncharacterized protein LOC123273337 [Cotesia glomerata]
MTTETFYEYITNVFYPWLVQENTQFPVILYMDNHSSHLNLPLVTFCREKQIELIMLPPNSTHIMQPLDTSFFHPFKETWKKSVPKWKSQQRVTHIKKEDFPLALQFTLQNMKNAEKVVKSGFRRTGLYPFDASAVDYDVLNQGKKSKQRLETNDTKYSDEAIEKEQFLQLFEKNLPEELVSDFKEAQKPVIKKIEILNDRSIRGDLCTDIDSSIKTGIDSGVDLFKTNDQEGLTDVEVHTNLVSNDEATQSVIIFNNNFETLNGEQNTIGNEFNYEVLYELPVQIGNEEPVQIIDEELNDTNTIKTLTTCNENVTGSFNETIAIDISNDHLLSQNDSSNVQLIVENHSTNQNHQTELMKENLENVCERSSGQSSSREEISSVTVGKDKTPLKEIFTLPVKYLPKKKGLELKN